MTDHPEAADWRALVAVWRRGAHLVRRAQYNAAHWAVLWKEEPLARLRFRNAFLRPYRKLQFMEFGAMSVVDRPTWLYGTHHIAIGDHVGVMRGAWLSVERAVWDRPTPGISIGRRAAIRPYVAMSASEAIIIEDYVGIGTFSSLVDSNHTFTAGGPHVLDNPVKAEAIRVGEGSWLGDRVAVLAGANIGKRCFIGANSVVTGTIPDYSVAVGAPARVIGSSAPDGRD